jgi:hypothetical protein
VVRLTKVIREHINVRKNFFFVRPHVLSPKWISARFGTVGSAPVATFLSPTFRIST